MYSPKIDPHTSRRRSSQVDDLIVLVFLRYVVPLRQIGFVNRTNPMLKTTHTRLAMDQQKEKA
ncbi:MAG: hypothetical protein EAZ61_01535 [Oscillatoriales cyanobacterium]|nr:MAG: hypothetical protein EAZ61_01535 [Oscillatoriales cyanobacterium]